MRYLVIKIYFLEKKEAHHRFVTVDLEEEWRKNIDSTEFIISTQHTPRCFFTGCVLFIRDELHTTAEQ